MEEIIKLPIEKGLSSKIYGLAFEKPKSGYELSIEIYDHYHHGVKTKINHLFKEGYLLEIPIEGQKHPKWLSDIEPLIIKIESILNSKDQFLTDFEKKVLRKRFNNEFFRRLSKNDFHYEIKTGPCNAVDSILGGFEMGLIIGENISYFREQSEKINTEIEYDKYLQQTKKLFESYKQRTPDIYAKARGQFDTNEDFLDSMTHSVVSPLPKSLFEKCKGVSSLGRKFHDIEWLIDNVIGFRFNDFLRFYEDLE